MKKQELVELVRANIGVKATLETDHTIHEGTIKDVRASAAQLVLQNASSGVKGERAYSVGDDIWLLPQDNAEVGVEQQTHNKIVVTWLMRGKGAAKTMNYKLTIHGTA